jgi:hypothetical protein
MFGIGTSELIIIVVVVFIAGIVLTALRAGRKK